MTSVAAEALPAQRLAHPLGQAVKNGVRDLSGEETIVMNLNNCHELDYGLFSGTENDHGTDCLFSLVQPSQNWCNHHKMLWCQVQNI